MSTIDVVLSGHLHVGNPIGQEETLGGMTTYTTGDVKNKNKSILFITDIFGYHLTNTRLLADEYAKAGFYVYVPDLFDGDYVPEYVLDVVAPKDTAPPKSFTEKALSTAKAPFDLGPWVVKHREAVSLPLIKNAVEAIRADPATGKLGAVGFCWGGRYAILLAHAGSQVDAAVAHHPSFLGLPDDVEPVAKPLAVTVGDKDSMLDQKGVAQLKEILTSKAGVPSEVTVYPGAHHGFTVRGDLNNETEREQKEQAAEQTIAWMRKYL
ncbi:putative cytoplasm protein [Sistotremastrum niveocremeum HHB9708]|uniref:Putative cytoplasm protein n=1 Tax=Sistotremastrum niveocremeum HHB9708 TaxID=1314777 RepID=A0A164XWN4_9AGAM|nr:putative cytoplasm protein [Sistotremastrum niveocremeum HHB9708]